MLNEKADKLAQMGRSVFGIEKDSILESAKQTIIECESFFIKMGLKTKLSDFNIRESDIDDLVSPVGKMNWKLGEHANIDSKVAKEIFLLRL